MPLDWFNARAASQVGSTLADCYLPAERVSAAAGRKTQSSRNGNADLQKFLQRVVREAGPLKLNLFKRAKLLNSFKWRLLERGVDRKTVDELTDLVLLQLSGRRLGLGASAGGLRTSSTEPGPSRRVPGLIADADARLAEGQYAEAAELLGEALEIEPRHAIAHARLGAALSHLTRYREAEQEFRRALELKPTCFDAQFNLGTLLRARGDVVAAETALRRAVKQNPRNTEALVSLGQTLAALDRMSEAKEYIEKALRVKPRDPAALGMRGWLASVEGRFDQAEKLYRNVLEIDPRRAEAWSWLTELRRMTAEDTDWLEGAERTVVGGIPPPEEATLRFAMGKYFDDLGNYPRAFEQYKRANELRKLVAVPYDPAARTAFVDDMIRVYTRACLAQRMGGASESERPVFVVGMMRSGTSLVEQIIASHPQATGAGELPFWNISGIKQQKERPGELPDTARISKLAESYLKVLAGHSRDALRVVDKSTFNSDHLGLIHAVLPNARIIYMRRDPIDTCLSCYFQDFVNMASFTMDLAHLAHYYREHHRLVAHWRSVLPEGALLEVPYWELVADQEGWTRKIIDFIGLPWDPRCLEFHKTERAVLTASNWQVRQKIYSSSVGRWKNYQKYIGPLLDLRKLES
jgi:tetratricopeptide (TPR) repeat protein